MRKSAQGSHLVGAFAVCVGFVMLIAGCEEKNLTITESHIEKSQLVAIENRQLKKRLEQRAEEIEEQKKLLEKCLQEKQALKEQLQKKFQDEVGDILMPIMEENVNLSEEIKNLKAQIEELKKELEEVE